MQVLEAVLCGEPILDGCSSQCYTGSMGDVLFERMGEPQRAAVMRPFNHYVERGIASFSDVALPMEAYGLFLENARSFRRSS